MRDKIKSKEYFDNYINKELEKSLRRERLIEQVIAQRGEDDAVKTARLSVLNYRIAILLASYSSGMQINNMGQLLSETIKQIKKTSFSNRYVEMLWLISLGILLDISDSEFNMLTEIVDRDNLNDYLIGTLIISRNPSWKHPDKSFKFSNPYATFLEILQTDTKNAADKLKKYLEKEWYKGHSDCGWYDTHKEKEDLYFGYWSFESAAVVKILGLDDSSFKDNPYYPYDLVHWNEK